MSFRNTRAGPSTSAPTDGSRTIVIHDSQPREDDDAEGSGADGEEHEVGVLALRGGPRSRQRVAWTEDVIDNEGMGKKKSKICCIYHKPKRFDESSDSDSSSSDDGSDSECDHEHHHHRHQCSSRRPDRQGSGDDDGSGGRQDALAARDDSTTVTVHEPTEAEPNAYEKQPPDSKRKGKGKRGGLAQDH